MLCHHCHKPLVDGACPDPIRVKSARAIKNERDTEAISAIIAEVKRVQADIDHAACNAEIERLKSMLRVDSVGCQPGDIDPEV